jgi:hypothetical protein
MGLTSKQHLFARVYLVVILTNAAVFYSISRNPQAVTSSGEVWQIGAWVTIITLFVLTVNLEFKGNIKNKPTPAQPDEFRKAVAAANMAIVKGAVTAPRKGGLSVYGTNVLMNLVNEIGALPTKNGQLTQFELMNSAARRSKKRFWYTIPPAMPAPLHVRRKLK